MKILKYIFYVVGVLVLFAIILGFVGPKSYDVHRSVVVASTSGQVWPYVSSAKNMQQWSPWVKKDTTTTMKYFGTDGTVGSGFKWESKELGKGEQTFTTLDPGKLAETSLKFFLPWGESVSSAYFNLQDTAGATKVTWGMKGQNDFMGKIFGSVMSMDKAIGKDYENGLTNLKALVEANVDTFIYQIDSGNFPGAKYFGVRRSIPIDKVISFYDDNLPSLIVSLESGGGKLAGAPVALFYQWDTKKGTTDIAVGITFTGSFQTPEGTEIITLPASKYLTTDYLGGYHGIHTAHEAMKAYIKDNKLEQVPPFLEAYMTDGSDEPDTTKHLTKVVYFVK